LLTPTSDEQNRYIPLEGTLYLRELGGYTTSSGRKTRYQRLLCSDNLAELSLASQHQLVEYGVGTVIDLRVGWEIEKYPNEFATNELVSYHNLPLYNEQLIAHLNEPASLAHLNHLVLELYQPQLAAIFKAVAHSNPAKVLVIHCSDGKDRTGLVIALLLSLLGVEPEIVGRDYSLSAYYLAPRVDEWRAQAVAAGRDMARFEADMTSHPQTILEALQSLTQLYGSVRTYFARLGLTSLRI
jgi:protein-tyrosine phosphatase